MHRNTLLLAALCAAACGVDVDRAPEVATTPASPDADCTLPPHYEVLETGHIVVEGDIILGKLDDVRAACAAGGSWRDVLQPGRVRGIGVEPDDALWPGGRIPYRIDPDLPDPQRVLDAIAEWEAITMIDLVPKTSADVDYVNFVNADECASSVGRDGGRQDILLSTGKAKSDIVGTSISRVGDTYAWYADGMVSAGTTEDLDAVRAQYAYSLPPGYQISQIAGIGIAKSTGYVFVWYTNGMVSAGTSADLDEYRAPAPFSLPPGKSISQIVEIDIALDDDVYTWFSDGTVSIGTSTDLDAHAAPYPFVPAVGESIADLVGIGIAPSDGDVYAWYASGNASAGSSSDLDTERRAYAYATPKSCDRESILHEIGHAIGLNHEQSRCDRDTVARVFWANIEPGRENNFDKHCDTSYKDIGAYNATSIMQYESYNWSINASPTLLKLVDSGVPVAATRVIDMSISAGGDVYTWWQNGSVTSGTSSDLELHRARTPYTLPPGKTTDDIVGIAIAKVNGDTYTFYRDGTRSIGSTTDLDSVSAPVPYTLPPGYAPSDIVAIDIAPSSSTYVWFANGRRAYGTSTDLDANGAPIAFSLAPGQLVTDVLGIAISAAGDTYVWYDDGHVSTGTTTDLDAERAPYPFSERLDLFHPDDAPNAGDIDAVELLYANNCPYGGDYIACLQEQTVTWCKKYVLNCN